MPNGTALDITPGQLSTAELAGVGLAEALGGEERARTVRGLAIGRTRATEEQSAIKRQEEREKQRRRTAELGTLIGGIAGFLIPGGAIFGAARLTGAGVGARLGGAAGQLFAGRAPGAAARAVPALLGDIGERRRLTEIETELFGQGR
ncbi:hypothetical protein LCGC14_0800280 [marine sediment metagenome]|uniref:Uncharacterized protein n=1 Tax=marine sediment metagenome TaxID=412755 RepID=A0A0F9PUC9_9ZZZZ